MKGIVRVGALGAAIALVGGAGASAGINPNPAIEFDNDSFNPGTSNSVVSAGFKEGVWIANPNPPELPHNIREDHKLFRSGPPNLVPEKQLDIAAGTYHYYCEVHGSRAGGMDGVIKVRPVSSAGNGESSRVFWADSEAEAKHRYMVQFRVQGSQKWKIWKRKTRRTNALFGANNKPVNANPNKTYEVRAKTFVPRRRSKKPTRKSRFSPKHSFDVAAPPPPAPR